MQLITFHFEKDYKWCYKKKGIINVFVGISSTCLILFVRISQFYSTFKNFITTSYIC